MLTGAGAVGKGLLTAAATGVGDLVAQKLVNGNVDIKRNLLVAGTAGLLTGGASLLSDKLAPKISSGLSKGISKLKSVFSSTTDDISNVTANTGKRLEPNLQLFGDSADDVVKEIPKTKPEQVHHYATDKSKTYTQSFKDITNKYDLVLNSSWNKEPLPHQGRHPNEYHDFVLNKMREIDNTAKGNKDIFLDLYESEIKGIVRETPDMLYSDYWKNLK